MAIIFNQIEYIVLTLLRYNAVLIELYQLSLQYQSLSQITFQCCSLYLILKDQYSNITTIIICLHQSAIWVHILHDKITPSFFQIILDESPQTWSLYERGIYIHI